MHLSGAVGSSQASGRPREGKGFPFRSTLDKSLSNVIPQMSLIPVSQTLVGFFFFSFSFLFFFLF